ncbi:MAG TPA: DNA recombination protein RecF [Nitrospinae bacterium]|nr:DNA recombination protein RecF [Nitrospinota bacterium]
MKRCGKFVLIIFFYFIFPQAVNGEDMVFVKGGCFQLGDIFGDGDSDEKPVHEVCVDDFYIGKYELTVSEFREFVNTTGYMTEGEIGDGCSVYGGGEWKKDTGREWKKDRSKSWRNPSFSQGNNHPVSCVSWRDAVVYIEWLSNKTGKRYRLPTEAEWEYAARSGGKVEKWAGTNNESELMDYAWYNKNSGSKTHPVGQKKSNGLGLYDMAGNVWEWCSDWFDEKYYSNSPKDNPKGADNGIRVLRGGSWYNAPHRLRTSVRAEREPDKRADGSGFRLAASVKEQKLD